MEKKYLIDGKEYFKIRSVDLLRYASPEEQKKDHSFSRNNNFLEINIKKKHFFSSLSTYYVPKNMLFESRNGNLFEVLTGIMLEEGIFYDWEYIDANGNRPTIEPVFDRKDFLANYKKFSPEELEIIKQKYIAFNDEGKKYGIEEFKQLVKHY